MAKKPLSAKVDLIEELRIVPIYVGDMKPSLPIESHDVVKAAARFESSQRCIGFAFAQAVSGSIAIKGREDTIDFANEEVEPTRYLFATKIILREEFTTAAQYKADFERAQKNNFTFLMDEDAVLYEFDMRVCTLGKMQQDNTIIIDKKGQQLWPQPKA